jgi:sigma-B regulation protein RsbU (phosphoserine phosphatase)
VFSTFLERFFFIRKLASACRFWQSRTDIQVEAKQMTSGELVVDVSQDWVLACDVQRRFMEGLALTGNSVDFSGQCRQLRALGGDCYDYMPLDDTHAALVAGDASGKGLAAALMIANVQASLRTAASLIGNDPSRLLRVVNHQTYTSSLEDRYATVFYGVFDRGTRTLHYVNAGHNPPVILRANGTVHWLETCGAPVGLFADSLYEEGVVHLNPGDLVLAYSDGVVEAANRDGEEWGIEGLIQATAAWRSAGDNDAEDLVRWIFNSLDDFSEGCQSDDATVAVLRVL